MVQTDEHSAATVLGISTMKDPTFCSDIVSPWIPKVFSVISLGGISRGGS